MKMMHITIQTQNFNEEIKFYQEIIGLSIQHEMNGMGRHIVFLGDNEGGMPIEIIDRPDAENSGNQFLSMGYKTDDVVKMRETLMKKGYDVSEMIMRDCSARRRRPERSAGGRRWDRRFRRTC